MTNKTVTMPLELAEVLFDLSSPYTQLMAAKKDLQNILDSSIQSNSDFWSWLDSAYRDGGEGDQPKFTKYNMEVAYQAGFTSATIVESATCAQCNASTADFCNQSGCGYLETGNGAPAVERQEPVAWIKQKTLEALTPSGMVYVTGFDLGNSIPLYTRKDARPEHLNSIRMLEASIRVSKGWIDNVSNPNKDHDRESIAEVCRSVSRLMRDTLSALSSRGDTPPKMEVVLPERRESKLPFGAMTLEDAEWNACLDKFKELNQ